MRPVYLDYNATTPLDPRVFERMLPYYLAEVGNPGSRTHLYGQKARDAVENARVEVAGLLGWKPEEVVFTSGATESNNLALLGSMAFGLSHHRRHILATGIEHKSVLEPLERLRSSGFEVELVPVTAGGFAEPEEIARRLRPDTLLVSMMHANNETGVLQPVLEVSRILADSPVAFHVDAAQTFGKRVAELRNLDCDFLSISGHKIYGPAGIGALRVRRRPRRLTIEPLMRGGGQERGLRPGTLPVPLIVGLGAAAELAGREHEARSARAEALRRQLLSGLEAVDHRINGDPKRMQPHVLNVSFPGVDSEALMLALRYDMAISNGSACSSSGHVPSHVLWAMGLPPEPGQGSFGDHGSGDQTARGRAGADVYQRSPCVSRPAPASILDHFHDLPDPRRETRNKKHRLIDILVLALCGTIAGCQSAVEIAAYGRAKRQWLKTFLPLANGIPSHDTFSRVLQLLDARKFHDCFVAWVQALHELTRGQIVPIDGKTLRRSFDSASDRPPLHLVSAWAAENRLVLGEVPVDDKSNEITAIPKLLEILVLTGAIVTIDAMGCQKEIAAKVRQKEADYVLAVKENQPHLYEDLSDHFDRVLEDEDLLPRGQRHVTKEKNRGREEHRTYISTPVPEDLRNREAWRDLTSVGCVVSVVHREGKETVEVRYYISSLKPNAKLLAKAARGHWGIENSQHWVLDVVFQEDQCRARLDNAAENLALLRRLAMNLMAKEGTKHASLRVKGRTAGWDDDFMTQILTAGTT